MSTRQIKFTISQPVEYPGRTMPYAVRWRLNGRGYWRSFASKRGNNGADAFYSLLKVAGMNERDWSPDTGLPSHWKKNDQFNVAQYCRLYIQDQWTRFSPSTRKSYVEALTSFIVNCTRRGVRTLPSDCRGAISSWLTPTLTDAAVNSDQFWIWSDEPLPQIIRQWLAKNSPSIGDLDREILYETDRRMRLRLDGHTLYAPTTQNRLVTVAKTALSAAVKRGLIDSVSWPQRESGATAKSELRRSDDPHDDEVPSVKQLTMILEAMVSHQPASHLYRTLSAVCGFAGLRPGAIISSST